MESLKYAISISDGRSEDWYYYRLEEDYKRAFNEFKESESDIHGHILNDNDEYEVIDSYWDGEE